MAVGPTHAVTDPRIKTISCMVSTQEFKTELLLNTAGYYIDQDPASLLIILPTDKLAQGFTKDRLDPLLDETPCLVEVVPSKKSRSQDRTLERVLADTGALIDIVGANSPTDLSSRPKRIVLADEVDKYPASAGKEGDPLALAEERQSTFWNRKSVRTCSPTNKGFSRIGREYDMSDQRKLFVRCPHCDHAQPLTFKHVHWEKDTEGNHLPETAGISCKGCGVIWTEKERREAIKAVVNETDFGWRQTKPFKCCGEDHKPLKWEGEGHWDQEGRALCPTCLEPGVSLEHAGFNASKLYSLSQPLSRTVQKFIGAKGDPSTLQVFVNTQLAEEWEEGSVKVDPDGLLSRREVYGPDDLPEGVLVLTAGVDVQDNRLELEIVGWGAGQESWGVVPLVLYGDPSQDAVWNDLESWLLRDFLRADGRLMRIQAAAIDSGGHHTEKVYQFCDKRVGRRVHAIKGDGGAGKPIWPRRASKSKTGFTLYMVGAHAASDQIYGNLRTTEPGAGYCHYSQEYDLSWFKQLLAEKLIVRKVGGQNVRAYECPKGTRNEAHDCRRYALAALLSLPRKLPPAPPKAPKPESNAEERSSAPAKPPAPPPKKKPKRRRRRGYNDTGDSWL